MSSIIRENTYFDNEVDFCRVTGDENRERLENLFLKNRISYFIRWEEKSFLGKIFASRKPNVVIFRINSRDVALANEVVQNAEGVEVICPKLHEDWSPKAKTARSRQSGEETDEEGY